MRKKTLFQFREVERTGKRGQRHGQETQRVDEFDRSAAEGQDFGVYCQLFRDSSLSLIEFMKDEHCHRSLSDYEKPPESPVLDPVGPAQPPEHPKRAGIVGYNPPRPTHESSLLQRTNNITNWPQTHL